MISGDTPVARATRWPGPSANVSRFLRRVALFWIGRLNDSCAVLTTSEARTRGHAGDRHLGGRWIGYLERRRRPVIANVASARELSGWCWSLATGTPPAEAGSPRSIAMV